MQIYADVNGAISITLVNGVATKNSVVIYVYAPAIPRRCDISHSVVDLSENEVEYQVTKFII